MKVHQKRPVRLSLEEAQILRELVELDGAHPLLDHESRTIAELDRQIAVVLAQRQTQPR